MAVTQTKTKRDAVEDRAKHTKSDRRTHTGILTLVERDIPEDLTSHGQLWVDSSNNLYLKDGDGNVYLIGGAGVPNFKSYNVTTQGLGSNPDVYAGGYYQAPATDANLTQASTSQNYGSANVAYASHAFIVAGGAGSVNTGQVGLRVTGTSINDQGVRTTSDSEVLTDDITTLTTDGYLETNKKWLGTVTFELYTVSGSPTTYSADFNYGLCKYEDFGNRDFKVTDFEVVGFAGANDSNFEIVLFKHSSSGWTYHATAFSPSPDEICRLTTDHSTDDQLGSGQHFAFKRDNLDTDIDGDALEGVVVRVESSANNALEYANIHIGVQLS